MFSFIHAADLHLDSPLEGLSRHEGAPVEEIRSATRRALENLVELAIDREVDFVVIAGDLYDGDQRDFSTALFFNQQMLRLKKAEIPVFAISGNHDAASVITKSLDPPGNVHFFPSAQATTVTLPDHPVAIHGQSFAQAAVLENLAVDYPDPVAGRFNVGILHTSLKGSAAHDPYAPCSAAELTQKGYNYWALGHIHQPEVVQENPWIVFPGNLQGRKVNEAGSRGCCLVEVGDDLEVTTFEHMALDVVRWTRPTINVEEILNVDELRREISKTLAKTLEDADGRLAAVRLTLQGSSPLHGQLHSERDRWQAECVSIAHEIDPRQLWFEKLKIRTKSISDPGELAKRDDLTAMVLDALADFQPEQKPASIQAMEAKLPHAVLTELEGENDAVDLREQVEAIVLHRISMSSTD